MLFKPLQHADMREAERTAAIKNQPDAWPARRTVDGMDEASAALVPGAVPGVELGVEPAGLALVAPLPFPPAAGCMVCGRLCGELLPPDVVCATEE